MEYSETNICLRWGGQVAARLYGNPLNQHVLVVHGILDNVGSMHRLIKSLPNNFYYIAIDLPGHGKSSHLPRGMIYHTYNNFLVYLTVMNHFQNDKYIILAHSYGAQIGLTFSQIYPKRILKLIMLDTLHMMPFSTVLLPDKITGLHDAYFATASKIETGKPPEYRYEEALEKLMHQRQFGEISVEAAVPLLERMSTKSPDGSLTFNTDQRIKFCMNPTMDMEYAVKFFKKHPPRCPVLVIIASESDGTVLYYKPIFNLFRNSRNFKIVRVEGNHDVHNVYPERVTKYIRKFMLECRSKL